MDREGRGGGSGGTGRRIGRDRAADREGQGGGSGGTGRRIGREEGVISDLAVIYGRSIGG